MPLLSLAAMQERGARTASTLTLKHEYATFSELVKVVTPYFIHITTMIALNTLPAWDQWPLLGSSAGKMRHCTARRSHRRCSLKSAIWLERSPTSPFYTHTKR